MLRPHVVPANAGTHSHRRMLLSRLGHHRENNASLWLWVPAFRGDDEEECVW